MLFFHHVFIISIVIDRVFKQRYRYQHLEQTVMWWCSCESTLVNHLC